MYVAALGLIGKILLITMVLMSIAIFYEAKIKKKQDCRVVLKSVAASWVIGIVMLVDFVIKNV